MLVLDCSLSILARLPPTREKFSHYLQNSQRDIPQPLLLSGVRATVTVPIASLMVTKAVILCVDDEPIVLRSLRGQILQHFGKRYVCEIAESSEEALEIIEELHADGTPILAIVSDWLMPEMKGDEFLIKVHQRFPNIVKILLTGQADPEAIARATEQANLFSYLSKPWEESTLVEVLSAGLASLERSHPGSDSPPAG